MNELELARAQGLANSLARMLRGEVAMVDPRKQLGRMAEIAGELCGHLDKIAPPPAGE